MNDSTNESFEFTTKEQEILLKLARESVTDAVMKHKTVPDLEALPPALQRPAGIFVTLYEADEKLRGCIGYIEAHYPLALQVVHAAAGAAVRDPRFLPVIIDEVDNLKISISVLSPLEKIVDERDVSIGKHGLVVERGSKRGLLLPQVATRLELDAEEFLAETCRKARLPRGAWKAPDTALFRFSTVAISE